MKNDLYKKKEDIINWLNQYSIKNYELIEDKKYGYVVNVNNDVTLRHIKLNKIKFNQIDKIINFNRIKY